MELDFNVHGKYALDCIELEYELHGRALDCMELEFEVHGRGLKCMELEFNVHGRALKCMELEFDVHGTEMHGTGNSSAKTAWKVSTLHL